MSSFSNPSPAVSHRSYQPNCSRSTADFSLRHRTCFYLHSTPGGDSGHDDTAPALALCSTAGPAPGSCRAAVTAVTAHRPPPAAAAPVVADRSGDPQRGQVVPGRRRSRDPAVLTDGAEDGVTWSGSMAARTGSCECRGAARSLRESRRGRGSSVMAPGNTPHLCLPVVRDQVWSAIVPQQEPADAVQRWHSRLNRRHRTGPGGRSAGVATHLRPATSLANTALPT